MVPRTAALALVVTTGCSAVFGLEPPKNAPADSSVDGADVTIDSGRDACASSSTVVDTCTLQYAEVDAELPIGLSFDTNTKTFSPPVTNITATEVQTPTGPAIVIAVRSIHVQQFGVFHVTGSKPLIVAVSDKIVVDGIVDVSNGGAGARSCSAGAGQDDLGGAAGGAGASFNGTGGKGGDGDSDGSSSMGGSTNTPVALPAGLLGGCRGGAGGSAGAAAGGVGGPGGGAIALVGPRVEIDSNGQVNASGGGGRGGNNDSGGGGGGSGGFILFDSPTIIIAGKLGANGGGGGEGAGANGGNDGNQGSLSLIRAAGGSGGAAAGGDGGSGGVATTPNGVTSPDFLSAGGGGGGGGVGFIALSGSPTILSSALITPPISEWH